MDLNNEFEVPVGMDEAWHVLNDVERIAPCLPGAQLQEIEGDEFRGIVKVKVGPITAQYKGAAHFVEQNREAGRVVIKGEGRDIRGAGNANALITATMEAVSEDRTRVKIHTDLKVSGKVAQFGRGVMADISARLIDQFAANLEDEVRSNPTATPELDASSPASTDEKITPSDLAGAMATAASSVSRTPAGENATPVIETTATGGVSSSSVSGSGPKADSSGVRKIDSPDVDAVDLLDAAGSSMMKRALPVAGGLAVLLFVRRFLRR